MKRKGTESIASVMVMLMLVVIVGIPVVYTLTNSIVNKNIALTTVNNATLDFGTGTVNGTTKALNNQYLDGAALTLKWFNGTTNVFTLTSGTNYTLDTTKGVITLASDATSGNITATNRYWNATYQWRPETDAGNRTLFEIIPTLILVIIVVGIIGFVAMKR